MNQYYFNIDTNVISKNKFKNKYHLNNICKQQPQSNLNMM